MIGLGLISPVAHALPCPALQIAIRQLLGMYVAVEAHFKRRNRVETLENAVARLRLHYTYEQIAKFLFSHAHVSSKNKLVLVLLVSIGQVQAGSGAPGKCRASTSWMCCPAGVSVRV
jgi:hypothetical protein